MSIYRTIRPRSARPMTVVDYPGFAFGLNSAVPAHQILPAECSELVNFKVNRGGQLMTRPAVVSHTDTAVGAITHHAFANISGTVRELIVDTDKKLYYNNSGTPTRIGGTTLLSSNDAFIFPFKGVALICDGSYLKYADGVGATNLKIAYDDGSGTRGYQATNLTGTDDTTLAVGNGTNTRIAYKFTSQAWDAGYTIPPTTIEAYLTKHGTPTGAVTAKIRNATTDAEMATGTITDAGDIDDTTAEKYTATLTVTTQFSPSTAYYMTIEYAGGDVSNYVEVHCTTVASGGTAYVYAGSYTADATKTPIMGAKPGRPPKCAFGDVHGERPMLAGDSDNPGYVWYGNLTYLDFSSLNGGGFVGAVDEDANNYKVGGIKSFYGDLYVFGTEDQPYLGKLDGTGPSDWTLPALYQRQSATKRSLVGTVNDLWFASKDGADALSGVQEYGDIRTFSYSDVVADRWRDYWATSTALAGYCPGDGQYMVVMPTYHRVICFHTKTPAVVRGREIRYPVSEYEITREQLSDAYTYKWTASASGTNEYYCEALAGGTPGIAADPDFVLMDGKLLDEGTLGGLTDHQYKYGDNDTLGYSTLYIRDDSGDPDTTGVEIRTLIVPTTIAASGGVTYFGASDGFIYKLDPTDYKDMSLFQMRCDLKTQYAQAKFSHVNMDKQQVNIGGKTGAQFALEIYTDDQYLDETARYIYSLSIKDDLLAKDMTMDAGDAYFTVDPVANPMFREMDVNARSFMMRVTDVLLAGNPLFINGFSFRIRMLEA